jgi:hypothetical protein
MMCKVDGSQRSSDDGFLQEHSVGDPGRQSRVKAANFFKFLPDIYCVLIVYLTQMVKVLLFLPSVRTHNIARRSWWNRVLLARTDSLFSGQMVSQNDSEAIKS